MSKVLGTNCSDDSISFAMDDMSFPHCVWVSGGFIKYARFYGDEWRISDDAATIISSANTLKISKHCVGFNNGNCFFAYLDGNDLKLASWKGSYWSTEVVWANLAGISPLEWAVTWTGFPVVIVATGTADNQTIWEMDKSGINWSSPVGTSMPNQDNVSFELKAAKVASYVYVFWNGLNESSVTAWIGHTVWDVEAREWVYQPSKQVEMSAINGTVLCLDFVVGNELLSSSSESSESSESSMTS
jgi:hypothetical protein